MCLSNAEWEAISLGCPWPLWANTNSQPAGKREEWIEEPCTNCEKFLSVKRQWQVAVLSNLLPALDANKNIIQNSGEIRDFDTKGNFKTFFPYEKKKRKNLSFWFNHNQLHLVALSLYLTGEQRNQLLFCILYSTPYCSTILNTFSVMALTSWCRFTEMGGCIFFPKSIKSQGKEEYFMWQKFPDWNP